MNAKTSSESLTKNRLFIKYPAVYKIQREKNNKFIVKKLNRHHLKQVIKWNRKTSCAS